MPHSLPPSRDAAGRPGPPGAAFLLTQIGTHAAARFAERIAEHKLTPPQCGVLGLVSRRDGLSQHELAELLGMQPSRVVVLVDELESAGYVARVRDATDRRRNTLQLTESGRAALIIVGRVGRAHETEVMAALTVDERAQLIDLLTRVADQQKLTPGVHPGYRTLRPGTTDT